MLTDECEMRPFLEARGIEIIETDLGERIQQLDDEPPSHIVVPAVHKLRADVADVFSKTIGTEKNRSDVPYLAESQRQHTRPYYLKAGAGMTGANFAVAKPATSSSPTRACGPGAHLPTCTSRRSGSKVIPRVEDLGVFIRLSSRAVPSARRSRRSPRTSARRATDRAHVI
jgi:L-lactate dehydrogenase complex protein LldF